MFIPGRHVSMGPIRQIRIPSASAGCRAAPSRRRGIRKPGHVTAADRPAVRTDSLKEGHSGSPGCNPAVEAGMAPGDIHHGPTWTIALIVFAGGAVGTWIRWAVSGLPATGRIFHWGTFLANMLASACFSFLTAFLANRSAHRQGQKTDAIRTDRENGQTREASGARDRADRQAAGDDRADIEGRQSSHEEEGCLRYGLGTGLCGGLSTMSTLLLEVLIAANAGEAGPAFAYLATTVCAGLVLSLFMSALASWCACVDLHGRHGSDNGLTAKYRRHGRMRTLP